MKGEEYRSEWINNRYAELKKHPELVTKHDEITDFIVLITCVYRISNLEYQERIWIKHETPDIVDSFEDTTMYFSEDAEIVIENYEERQTIRMSLKQYTMLKKLYKMVDDYESNDDNPYCADGSNDQIVVYHPEWAKVREYAKKVYEVLIEEKES